MNKFRFTINVLAIAIFTFAFASIAQAQATRTWVSGVGDDVNPCSRTAPCKTFAGAISKTATNGEISVLDPGGFGAVTITKGMTLNGDGTLAGILNSLTTGVVINAAGASVTIRSISIQGAGNGTRGIRVDAAAKVFIENCSITGQAGDGITDNRAASGSLDINNTTISNNTGTGIDVNNTGTQGINVHVSESRVQGNGANGLLAGTNVFATVFDSSLTGNVTAGIFSQAPAGASIVNVDHCVVANNVTGFQANTANTTIRVSNTNAAGNGTLAGTAGGGAVSSYGNNQTGGLAFPSTGTGQTE